MTYLKRTLKHTARLGIGLAALLALTGAPALYAEPIRMTLLSPDPDGRIWFWEQTERYMRAAAEDLDIQFDIVRTHSISTYTVKKDGLSILNRDAPPDYVLTGYWNESVGDLLEASRDSGVRFFLFNSPVGDADRAAIGRPRERFKHWIGHLYPDDAGAGYELARILFEHARNIGVRSDGGGIQAAGLTGDSLSPVSNARESGLRKAVKQQSATLNATVATAWQAEAGERATADILSDFPQTSVFWTATDALALGVIDVLKRRGLVPGKDAVTGGFDWSPAGFEAIRDGRMYATMGGHFVEGLRAMILAYDYHHGFDFADRSGATINTAMQAVIADNVEEYTAVLNNSDVDTIDFKRLSRRHNQDVDDGDFSPASLMQRLGKCKRGVC